MKKTATITVATVSILVTCAVCTTAVEPPAYLVALRVDPNTSVIEVLPGSGRDVINSSFTMVSATCTNCGGGCPPADRSIAILLEALTDVSTGYGVSDVVGANYTPNTVMYSTRADLSTGDLLTVTVSGDVLDCSQRFNVFFSMCDNAQSDFTAPCRDAAIFADGFESGDLRQWD